MRLGILIAGFAIALSACGPQGPSQADIMAGRDGSEEGTPAPVDANGPQGSQGGSNSPIPVPYGNTDAMTPQRGLAVVLTGYGDSKISVIQAVMAARPDLGLAEAKALVEAAPQPVRAGLSAADATALQNSIQAAGGSVSIQ